MTNLDTNGLYCKSGVALAVALAVAFARVMNYAPKVMLQIVATLTDNSEGVIYKHYVYITGHRTQFIRTFPFVISQCS